MNSKEDSSAILSQRQRKFIGFVVCCAGALLLGVLITVLVVILNRAFAMFGGVIWSLAVSGMLAIMLRPIVSFFDEKMKLGRIGSILLLYLLVVSSCGSAVWFLGGKVIGQTREFIGTTADWPEQIESKANATEPWQITGGGDPP